MPARDLTLVSIDVGTTHCKAALLSEQGEILRLSKMKTISYADNGWVYYNPEQLWTGIAGLIREVVTTAAGESEVSVGAIGITSMAETGVLIDPATGEAKSPFIPWFSKCSVPQAEDMAAEGNARERFMATGLHASFKYGLAKLLWLRQHRSEALHDAVWLSASDFIAYKLTGALATDYTLAARTFAFRTDKKAWDLEWIRHFGFLPSLFPEAAPSGAVIGRVRAESAVQAGLRKDIPVVIAGHDHIAASLALGVIRPGQVMDSMGTAETLVGVMDDRELTEEDFHSGLAFGCHPAAGRRFWMGGLSASGGSVEWFRSVWSDPPMSYEQLLQLLTERSDHHHAGTPTGILYFPYLSGSGAPEPDARARAAFIGLNAEHGLPDMLTALLEGTAYEMEWIRRAGEKATNASIQELILTGGGTHNPVWLQTKANVSGCLLRNPELPEAALTGAAMLAGVGAGVYADIEQAAASVSASHGHQVVLPQERSHAQYKVLFEEGYLPLQQPLRHYYRRL
ncbi:carbohydrate kinase [Paenibacillus lycopersici]|uniref:Carbohydrate kinase n=1 Tax=Paenibacillus lycopersici TaxID=2704462 RepID=A0A6C0G052_9BACL|nr:FGGY family carbohydrate kinase [Paenibacillus lycopersici]QHT61121.1 carbohydrate kinase [Paenibacillus lycopersici]